LTPSRAFIYSPGVTAPDNLLGKQISFGIAGVIFGFLLGFVVSHEVMGGRAPRAAAAPPAAQSGPGMGGGSRGADAAPGGGQGQMPGGAGMEHQVTEELNALRALLKEDPKNVQALMRLASLYMDAAMYDKALEQLRVAVEAAPDDVHVRTEMATAMLMTGQTDAALAELEACLKQDPKHSKTWYSLGFAYVQKGEYDKGEKAFAKALEITPGAFDMEALRAEIQRLKSQREGRPSGAPS
jgi:lipopolysaccharide biosynthesis regulator YciM